MNTMLADRAVVDRVQKKMEQEAAEAAAEEKDGQNESVEGEEEKDEGEEA